jgi:uncharacterized membrane protein YfhO/putative flippase GtrA
MIIKEHFMNYLKKLFEQKSIRYIFFGGCTTLVNVISYAILRYLIGINMSASNFISIFLAIIFAYIVNKIFVFRSKTIGTMATVKEIVHFVGMRLSTMFIEIFGMVFLSSVWGMNDMAAKFVIQFVVLVLNYVISKLFVFKESEKELTYTQKKLKNSRYWCFGLSFFIPVILIAIGFCANEVYPFNPFGDRAVLIIDSAHQYLPFFTEFLRKLNGGESLLYTFRGGMGINFWGLFAYYLASPLNFLIMLFTEKHVMEGMAFIILLKIGLSGGIFSYYLNTKTKKSNVTVIAFSIMFALSNFMIGYYFNIMWLDSIMLLPLVMLGIERLAKGKSGRFYGAFLGLVLFCNYYIGFMVCIFSCIYFLIQLIIAKKQTVKNVIRSCVSFGTYSLLAGGIASIVLIPAYQALKLSQSITDNGGFPEKIEFYTNFLNLLRQHFAFLEPINISDNRGDLNVYCGVLVLIVFFLYMVDNKVSLRERIAKNGLLILLFVSFNTNILNYIWHGFHMQNGLPNRFAFLYIALLLTMGVDAISHLKTLSIYRVIFACAAPILLTASILIFNTVEVDASADSWVYMLPNVVTAVFLCLYALLLILYKTLEWKKVYFQLTLFIIIIVELGANGIYGTIQNGTIGRSVYLGDQSNFQALIERTGDDSFYRSEMDGTLIRNEIMYQGGNGIVMFSSTVPYDMINFVRKLGMEGRTNKSGYPGATRLVNDILGIKYIASKTDTVSLFGFPKVDQEGNLTLYENDTALSLGFMVDSKIKEWNIEEKSHTQVQDDFISLATGEASLYRQIQTYSLDESDEITFTLLPNEQMYLDLEREVEKVEITAPDYTRKYDKYTDHLYDLGCYEDGAQVTVKFTLKEDSKTVDMVTYGYQEDEYDSVYEALSRNQMEVTKQEANEVLGNISVDKAGTLLLTVPYEKGWEVLVDGEKTETYPVGGSIIGVDLGEGIHTIQMKYTPPGLWIGSVVSIVSIAAFLLCSELERKLRKRSEEKRKMAEVAIAVEEE